MKIKALVVAVLAALLALTTTPASALTWKQWDLNQVNHLRAQHHERALVFRTRLQVQAQRWANQMAAAQLLRQDINVGPCWAFATATAFGDNVGDGPTVPLIEQALERSPSHRANLLDRKYRFVGIGIARANGFVYMDQVFCG